MQFPGLDGVLPGFGRQTPNDWGLGIELRDAKAPHWTGERNSPRTYGHFGRSGTFLWVDPDAGVALACLTDRDFGDWAKEAWPRLVGRRARRAPLTRSVRGRPRRPHRAHAGENRHLGPTRCRGRLGRLPPLDVRGHGGGGADAGPAPIAFDAVTVNVYATSFARLVTTAAVNGPTVICV